LGGKSKHKQCLILNKISFTYKDFQCTVEERADIEHQKNLNNITITEIMVLMDFDS